MDEAEFKQLVKSKVIQKAVLTRVAVDGWEVWVEGVALPENVNNPVDIDGRRQLWETVDDAWKFVVEAGFNGDTIIRDHPRTS